MLNILVTLQPNTTIGPIGLIGKGKASLKQLLYALVGTINLIA